MKISADHFQQAMEATPFLERIEALNGRVNAYVTVTPGLALEQARRLEQELARVGGDLGSLAAHHAGDGDRLAQPARRLPGDCAAGHEQEQRIDECDEHRRTPQPEGEACVGQTRRQRHRAPGEQQREHVAQVVPGVGEQGERMGPQSGPHLKHDEADVQCDADCEGAP